MKKKLLAIGLLTGFAGGCLAREKAGPSAIGSSALGLDHGEQKAVETKAVAARGSFSRYIPNDFPTLADGSYAAVISSNAPVAAEVSSSDGSKAFGYASPLAAANALYVPRLMKEMPAGWNSGLVIQNTDATATANVDLKLHDSGGYSRTDRGPTRGHSRMLRACQMLRRGPTPLRCRTAPCRFRMETARAAAVRSLPRDLAATAR